MRSRGRNPRVAPPAGPAPAADDRGLDDAPRRVPAGARRVRGQRPRVPPDARGNRPDPPAPGGRNAPAHGRDRARGERLRDARRDRSHAGSSVLQNLARACHAARAGRRLGLGRPDRADRGARAPQPHDPARLGQVQRRPRELVPAGRTASDDRRRRCIHEPAFAGAAGGVPEAEAQAQEETPAARCRCCCRRHADGAGHPQAGRLRRRGPQRPARRPRPAERPGRPEWEHAPARRRAAVGRHGRRPTSARVGLRGARAAPDREHRPARARRPGEHCRHDAGVLGEAGGADRAPSARRGAVGDRRPRPLADRIVAAISVRRTTGRAAQLPVAGAGARAATRARCRCRLRAQEGGSCR